MTDQIPGVASVIEGERLIAHWINAQNTLDRANSAVRRAECDVTNTRNALAKWLTPADAKEGEKFHIWHGDSLIEVLVKGIGIDPVVVITKRKRGAS